MKKNIEFVKRADIWTGKLTVKAAFTLAELLITLVIIGVVAVITIPGLVQNYKKTEYSARLKKFYSTMQQAIQMSEIDNGPLENWEFSRSVNDEDGNYAESNYTYADNWLKKYILPYIKYNKYTIGHNEVNDEGEIEKNSAKIYMNDGSIIYVHYGWCMDIDYDVNGGTGYESGRDMYIFTFCFANSGNGSIGFHPYLYSVVTSRADALDRCERLPQYCSVLLQYDGWEFKKDYPYKL